MPADPAESAKLAPRYANAALGEIAVSRANAAHRLRLRRVAERGRLQKNPDGTISFVTTAPGISGFEFVVGAGPKKTLVTRDAQHEYVFEAP